MSTLSVIESNDSPTDIGNKVLFIRSVTGVYQALDNYTPKQEGEMNLIKGDIITEVKPLSVIRAIGRNYRGFVGTFPLQIVSAVNDTSHAVSLPIDSVEFIKGVKDKRNDMNDFREQVKSFDDLNTFDSFEQYMNEPIIIADSKPSETLDVQSLKSENSDSPSSKTDIVIPFLKPNLLGKPSQGKLSELSQPTKRKPQYRMKTKSRQHNAMHQLVYHSTKLTNRFNSQVTTKSDSYYATPSSTRNFHCHCGDDDETEMKKKISSLNHYENVSIDHSDPMLCSTGPSLLSRSNMSSKVSGIDPFHSRSSQVLYAELGCKPRVGERPLIIANYNCNSGNKISALRIIGALFNAILTGGVIFIWMTFLCESSISDIYIVAGIFSVALFIITLISKLVRCMCSILLSSLASDLGRTFILIMTWVAVGWGPVQDINNNLFVTVNSTTCILEQLLNQTNLLMQPYDTVMEQVNKTMSQIEIAAREVNFGLLPLDHGLEHVEMSLNLGRHALIGTKKTCQEQLARAYFECSRGMAQALDECKQIKKHLRTIYHHARQALDQINWDSDVSSHTKHRHRRNIENESDICRFLDEQSTCKFFNKSSEVCKPALWAGDAIQEAVNATQTAMKRLHKALQFHLTTSPYWSSRESALGSSLTLRKNVINGFIKHFANVDFALLILLKFSPLWFILVIISAYNYIKSYIVDIEYDNYLNTKPDAIVQLRSPNCRDSILSHIRRHEQVYIKKRLCIASPNKFSGFLSVNMHLLLVLMTYLTSYKIYFLLLLLSKEGTNVRGLDGNNSIELVIAGEGMIVELLELFLRGLHPNQLTYRNIVDVTTCLSPPQAPSLLAVIPTLCLITIFLISFIFRKQLHFWRNRITGQFYVEECQARLSWLCNHISHRRSKYPGILFSEVIANYNLDNSTKKISWFHWYAYKIRQLCKWRHQCLLCGHHECHLIRRCVNNCEGMYCLTCLSDMAHICPLCWTKWS